MKKKKNAKKRAKTLVCVVCGKTAKKPKGKAVCCDKTMISESKGSWNM